jgi:hypothetical protein
MLVIQRITTDWTKSSRGGTGAATRNAVPESLVLPPFVGGANAIVHEATYLENDAFRCRDKFQETEISQSWHLGAMMLYRHENYVSVKFSWQWDTAGAPERWPHEAFALRPGQWGQLRYNGRFGPTTSCGAVWWYRKEVFNIAFVDPVNLNLFVATQPNFSKSEMARLR